MDIVAKNVLEIMRKHRDQFDESLVTTVEFEFSQRKPQTYSDAVEIVDQVITERTVPAVSMPTTARAGSWPPRVSTDVARVEIPKKRSRPSLLEQLKASVRPTSPRGNNLGATRIAQRRLR